MSSVNFEREQGKGHSTDSLLRLMAIRDQEIERRLKNAGSANITVVVGSGSSGSSGTSTSAEMRVGRASVGAGSVVVTFSSNMSTVDYELVCLMKDDTGVFQTIDTHTAVKTISGFTVDTYSAGVLIYIAIPRQ